jgi:hypothetical protein
MIQRTALSVLQRFSHPIIRKFQSVDFPEGNSVISQDQRSAAENMFFSTHKNVNLPWIAATSLAVWFLFIHTPPFWISRKLFERDGVLAVHIIAAGTIYFSCAHNCIFTPSFTFLTIPFKNMHIWVGRIGLLAGVVSFSLGAFLAWSRLGLQSVGGTTLGFALPITIGGVAQLSAQYNGYKAIRQYKTLNEEITARTKDYQQTHISKEKEALRVQLEALTLFKQKALRNHIGNMISLFVSACGIPAGIRLAELATGEKNEVATIFAIVAVIGVLSLVASRYMKLVISEISHDRWNSSRNEYGSIN